MPARGNEIINSNALYFDPLYYKMKLRMTKEGVLGPAHDFEKPGVEILENGDVLFTYYAPQAKEVAVAGMKGSAMSDKKHYMIKDDDGYWQVKLSGIPTGFHYHLYYIDGTAVTNSLVPYAYGCNQAVNFFEVPGIDSDFYLLNNISHGSVEMAYYFSRETGRTRNCWVYLPPDYHSAVQKHYPVLYLHHGGGENEGGWIWQGKINCIMDNLLASNECAEMIIVMNCIYAYGSKGALDNTVGNYDSVLINDCIPFIQSRYRVKTADNCRAIAGLSMGSYQTVMTSMKHLGFFPYIGIFSGSLDKRWYCDFDYEALFNDTSLFNEKVKLLFIGAGDKEPIFDNVRSKAKSLKDKGLPVVYRKYGGHHEWTVWRSCARDFLRLVFK